MPRFYIDPSLINQDVVVLSKEESHHALTVLRVKNGDDVELFDGKGKSLKGQVVGRRDGCLAVRIQKKAGLASSWPAFSPSPVPVTLAISVIKPERMELLVQKACELGVYALIPVISDRCVIKLSRERWASKIKRWQKIALQSCKQCGRSEIPEIRPPLDYEALIGETGSYDKILISTLALTGDTLYNAVAVKDKKPKSLLALIGPEGDFTEEEARHAVAAGGKAVSLGPLVLRTETAAIYLLSVLNFFYREIDGNLGAADRC